MPDNSKERDLKRQGLERRQSIARGIGIAADFRPVRLVYNECCGMIVAAVERISSDTFEQRLFYRPISTASYRLLGEPREDLNFSEVITSQLHPFVYCRATRVKRTDTPGEFAGNWASIERFDLMANAQQSVITAADLTVPEPYTSGWVFQLHGLSTDEKLLICTCGLQRSADGRIDHKLCGLSQSTQKLSIICDLQAVWY